MIVYMSVWARMSVCCKYYGISRRNSPCACCVVRTHCVLVVGRSAANHNSI